MISSTPARVGQGAPVLARFVTPPSMRGASPSTPQPCTTCSMLLCAHPLQDTWLWRCSFSAAASTCGHGERCFVQQISSSSSGDTDWSRASQVPHPISLLPPCLAAPFQAQSIVLVASTVQPGSDGCVAALSGRLRLCSFNGAEVLYPYILSSAHAAWVLGSSGTSPTQAPLEALFPSWRPLGPDYKVGLPSCLPACLPAWAQARSGDQARERLASRNPCPYPYPYPYPRSRPARWPTCWVSTAWSRGSRC